MWKDLQSVEEQNKTSQTYYKLHTRHYLKHLPVESLTHTHTCTPSYIKFLLNSQYFAQLTVIVHFSITVVSALSCVCMVLFCLVCTVFVFVSFLQFLHTCISRSHVLRVCYMWHHGLEGKLSHFTVYSTTAHGWNDNKSTWFIRRNLNPSYFNGYETTSRRSFLEDEVKFHSWS